MFNLQEVFAQKDSLNCKTCLRGLRAVFTQNQFWHDQTVFFPWEELVMMAALPAGAVAWFTYSAPGSQIQKRSLQ